MTHAAVLAPLILGGLTLAISVLAYGRLPGSMAVHWNMHGEADGFMPRPVGAYALPILILLLPLIHAAMRRRHAAGAHARGVPEALAAVVVAMALVLALVHAAMIAAALGMGLDPLAVATGAGGVLLALVGRYLGKTGQNPYVGIRNRWTLAEPQIWDRTNRAAGWVFVIEGLAAISIAAAGWAGPRTAAGISAAFVLTLVLLQLYARSQWRNRPGSPGGTQ